MLYKIRSLCPTSVSRSLYYSLFNSHLSYGLSVWGSAGLADIAKIQSLQDNAIKSIYKINEPHNLAKKYFDLEILNINDQIEHQLSSLMWDYDHNTLPSSLKRIFIRIDTIHNYRTRGALRGNLYHKKVNTVQFGVKSFTYQGIHILNNLKGSNIYNSSKTKFQFLRQLKIYLKSQYV